MTVPDNTSDGRQRLKKRPKALEAFLEVLRKGGTVSQACAQIGVSRRTAFDWKANDPDFHREWTDAIEQGTDLLEAEAVRRARDGYVGRPFQTRDGEIIPVTEYSDTLMTMLLKGKRPHVYGDTTKHVGPDGGAIQIARVEHVVVDPPKTIK